MNAINMKITALLTDEEINRMRVEISPEEIKKGVQEIIKKRHKQK